ncbi:MAG: hypothetical protein O9333_04775 [Beijerinckiaceae bacterium]|nr:hypothetical protein [Beijerinckiaceae bacterium]
MPAWKRLQRYTPQLGKQANIQIVPEALSQFPKIAEAYSCALATFARAEFNACCVVAEFLGGSRTLQFSLVVERRQVLSGIRNFIKKKSEYQKSRDKSLLSDKQVKFYNKVAGSLSEFVEASSVRHWLAHGIIGVSEKNLDKIYIFDPFDSAVNIDTFLPSSPSVEAEGVIISEKYLIEFKDDVEKICQKLWELFQEMRDSEVSKEKNLS